MTVRAQRYGRYNTEYLVVRARQGKKGKERKGPKLHTPSPLPFGPTALRVHAAWWVGCRRKTGGKELGR